MFRAITLDEVARLRRSIERVGSLSDNLFRVGGLGIGLDGLLAWAPGLGAAYSVLASAYLLIQGYRARVPWSILAISLGLMSARSIVTIIGETFWPALPVELVVDVFRAHKWSADLMLRAIDATDYVPGAPVPVSGAFGRRMVFLG